MAVTTVRTQTSSMRPPKIRLHCPLCYTRRFATTIFSSTKRCNIAATLFRIVTLQCCVALKIVPGQAKDNFPVTHFAKQYWFFLNLVTPKNKLRYQRWLETEWKQQRELTKNINRFKQMDDFGLI